MSVPDSRPQPGAALQPVPQLLRLSVILAVAAVAYFIVDLARRLGQARPGLQRLLVRRQDPQRRRRCAVGPVRGNVDWAGGPSLLFTYPPFAALLFGLLARLPQPAALTLFNAAGAAVAIWVAVRAVRYWNAKADWRTTFRSRRQPLGRRRAGPRRAEPRPVARDPGVRPDQYPADGPDGRGPAGPQPALDPAASPAAASWWASPPASS